MRPQLVQEALDYIKAVDRHQKFAEELKALNETEFRLKDPTHWNRLSRLRLFPHFNTCWGKRLIYLDPDFFKMVLINDRGVQFNNTKQNRAAVLIHEAVHEAQWKSLGPVQFLMNYAKEHVEEGYSGNDFEEAAERREQEFRREFGIR